MPDQTFVSIGHGMKKLSPAATGTAGGPVDDNWTAVDTALTAADAAAAVASAAAAVAAAAAATAQSTASGAATAASTAQSAATAAAAAAAASLQPNSDGITPFYRGNTGQLPGVVTLVALSIPALTAGARTVVTVSLGTLLNPKRAVIAPNDSGTVLANVQAFATNHQLSLNGNSSAGQPTHYSVPIFSKPVGSNFLFVSEDYRRTHRMGPTADNLETINASTQINQLEHTYTTIGQGVLIGWYGAVGAFGINKKVQVESMWLTTSGSTTTLNIAFKNVDSTNSAIRSINFAVYE